MVSTHCSTAASAYSVHGGACSCAATSEVAASIHCCTCIAAASIHRSIGEGRSVRVRGLTGRAVHVAATAQIVVHVATTVHVGGASLMCVRVSIHIHVHIIIIVVVIEVVATVHVGRRSVAMIHVGCRGSATIHAWSRSVMSSTSWGHAWIRTHVSSSWRWNHMPASWCHAWVGTHVSSTSWSHAAEEMSACISTMERTRNTVEVVAGTIVIVVVDAEVPATVDEHDGTVEVVVANQAIPDGVTQQVAESRIASCAYSHVVIVVVAQCYVVKIVVHTPDVIIVDTIDFVDEIGVADTQRICHAVGQEPCIALHCCDAHALSVHRHCSGEEDDSGEDSS